MKKHYIHNEDDEIKLILKLKKKYPNTFKQAITERGHYHGLRHFIHLLEAQGKIFRSTDHKGFFILEREEE